MRSDYNKLFFKKVLMSRAKMYRFTVNMISVYQSHIQLVFHDLLLIYSFGFQALSSKIPLPGLKLDKESLPQPVHGA